MQSKIAEIVFGQELIEQVGCDHDRGRDTEADSGKAFGDAPRPQKMPYESQTARFATKRSGTNPQKTRLRWFIDIGPEVADQDFVLLAAIIIDRFDQIAAQML